MRANSQFMQSGEGQSLLRFPTHTYLLSLRHMNQARSTSHSRVLKLLGLCGYVCTHINMFVCIYQPLCFSHHTSVCRGEIAVHQGFAQFSIDPRLGNTPSPDFLAFPGPSLLPSLSCLDLLQISSFPLEPQVRV